MSDLEEITIKFEYNNFEQLQMRKIDLMREAIFILESEDYCDTAKDLKAMLSYEHYMLELVYQATYQSDLNVLAAYAILKPVGDNDGKQK